MGMMPPKFNDLTGQKIGKLTVIKLANIKKDRCFYWECSCECGNTTIVKATCLSRKITNSCGCLKKTYFVDLSGQKFNEITITKYLGKNKYQCHRYQALCSCGKELIVEGNDVKSGRTKSCGHLKYGPKRTEEQYRQSLFKTLYNGYKFKAKERGYEFELSFEEFKNLVTKKLRGL